MAHDSTELRFSTERDGIGRIAGDATHGFVGHFALAVAASNRAPLGVLGFEPMFRERGTQRGHHSESRPIDDRESRRWLELVQRVDAVVGGVTTTVHVMDREADAYELLAALSAGRDRGLGRSH